MNIYFSCSITGGRQDEAIYRAIVDHLHAGGHTIPTADLADADVLQREDQVSAEEVYARDVRWVRECDALIAEVSTPSHGVGYEIALALQLGKPVLCCYRYGRRVSKMILGNSEPNLTVRGYHNMDDALYVIQSFLRTAAGL